MPLDLAEAVRKTWEKLPLLERTKTRWQLKEGSLTRMSKESWIDRVDWMKEPVNTISFAVTMGGKVIFSALTKRPE